MADSTGVTARTATRLSLIEAIRGARPSARGWRGRWSAIGDEELADAILARLPEAEPPAPDPYEISDEEFEAAKADLIERFGAVPPTLQRVIDRGGRFGMTADLSPADMVTVGREHLDQLASRAARLQQQVTGVRPLLERFAEPGVMSATARRQAAAEALRALDAAAGEAVAAGEPA
jgi:hypothetical protein